MVKVRSRSLKIYFLWESLSKFCMHYGHAKLYTLQYSVTNVTIYAYYNATIYTYYNVAICYYVTLLKMLIDALLTAVCI